MSAQLSVSEKINVITDILNKDDNALEEFSGIEINGDMMMRNVAWGIAEEHIESMYDDTLDKLYSAIEKSKNDDSYAVDWRYYGVNK